jgi:hypothetical protein
MSIIHETHANSTSRLSPGVLTASGCLAAAVAAARLPDVILSDGPTGLVCGVGLVGIAAAPLLWRFRRDVLDAPAVYGLATLAFLGLSSLAWLGTPMGAGPGLDEGDVAKALRVVALGLALFTVGAHLAGRAGPRRLTSISRSRAASAPAFAVAFLGATVPVAVALLIGMYGYISTAALSGEALTTVGIINAIGAIGGAVILALALTHFASGGPTLRLLVCCVAIQISLGVIAGIKGAALEPLVFVLLAYIAVRGKIPWVAIAIGVAISAFVLLPVNLIYRDQVRGRSESPTIGLQRAITVAASSTRPDELGGASLNPVSYFTTRFRQIDSVALIVSQTPSVYGFGSGQNYVQLPILLTVPRLLWPEKPALITSREFAQSYWQVWQGAQTSIGLTQVGDLFRNFGLIGVGIGLLFWGLALGGWSRWTRRTGSPRLQMIYLYSIPQAVVVIELGLPDLLLTLGRTIPLAALVAWLLLPGPTREPGYRQLMREPTAGTTGSAARYRDGAAPISTG